VFLSKLTFCLPRTLSWVTANKFTFLKFISLTQTKLLTHIHQKNNVWLQGNKNENQNCKKFSIFKLCGSAHLESYIQQRHCYTKYLMRTTDLSIHTLPLAARSFSTSCTTLHPISANSVHFAYLQTISCNHSCNVHGILCTWNFALHVNSNTCYKHLPSLLITHSIFHNPPLIYDTTTFVRVNNTKGQDRSI
jgi:hypothetical protein